MGTIHRFEEIEAWQTARELTKIVYDLTTSGPFSRDFGLQDQMRRAAVSIMSNIAEGFESRTSGLFAELLGRAKGSAGYLTQEQFHSLRTLCEKCSGQISGLASYIRSLPKQKRSASSSSSTLKPSNLSTFKPSKALSQPSNLPTFQPSNK